jgi:hypothetical protein
MKTFNPVKSSLHPSQKRQKYRFLYVALNIYLVIGVVSLLISIFYLLLNLEHADKIILYSVPGFVVFISSAILYIVGYQSVIFEKKSRKTPPDK